MQAIANLGHLEHAISASQNHCWEPMTRLGHGCFWELFDPDWGDLMHVGQKAPTVRLVTMYRDPAALNLFILRS